MGNRGKVSAEPGVDQLAKVIGVLETAHRVQGKLNDREAAVRALTLNQAVVVSEVGLSNGRTTMSTLAATLGRAVHTLASVINGLKRKGLVARHTVAGGKIAGSSASSQRRPVTMR